MQEFEYVAAHNLSEATGLLSEKVRARPLAGGTDILVQLRGDRRQVDRLVDVKHVPELNDLSLTKQGLSVGAAVPCYRIYEDASLVNCYPALADSSRLIGSIQIQGRASIGGNLCNAAPSADCIPSLIALGASCMVAGREGTRIIPVEQFCVAPGATILKDGELLVQLLIPPAAPRSGSAYLRFIPRNEMDIAVVGVGASVLLNEDGTVASARIALASVAPTPLYVEEAGAWLTGRMPDEDALREAGEKAKAAAKPITDMRGTIEQRKHLVGVLTRRTLQLALQRVNNGR